MTDHSLSLAGREVHDALDRVRRYCGVPWSGGASETWAWEYFDEVPSPADDVVGAIDVLAAGAIHPGLGREDLSFFVEAQGELSAWLANTPSGVPLADADEATTRALTEVFDRPVRAVSPTLLTKVLHRKRPLLVPLVDRHVLDWYRPITGRRGAVDAWPALIHALQADLVDASNQSTFETLRATLAAERGSAAARDVSNVRLLDIVVWMGSVK